MGEVKWTEEQSAAIYTRDCNLLVAAAAGSGKTAVLVQRIIEMITHEEDPIDIDRLLIVTFTNAAASEMRERIGEAISKEITRAQEKENLKQSKNLQRQLTLLNRASITTIHSFCLNIIKNNFHMLDLDPGFRVGDQTETELLKVEALEEVFEGEYDLMEEGSNEGFRRLIDSYCSNRDDERLKELILKIYSKTMSLPQPLEWINEKCEEFKLGDSGLEGSEWAKVFLRDIQDEMEGIHLKMGNCMKIIDACPDIEVYREMFQDELSGIEHAVNMCEAGVESLGEALMQIKFGRLKPVKNIEDTLSKDRVVKIRKSVKEDLEKIKLKVTSYLSSDSVEDLNYMYGVMKEIQKLIEKFYHAFKEKKKERGIIDFNDFEHFALSLLVKSDEGGKPLMKDKWYVPSKIAEETREKFHEILIDEYQDSNMVQEVVLNMISREPLGHPNIFMVGDVKQSIYKFRQANPKLFMDKYHRYSADEESLYRKILLFKNFRSRDNVVEGVNFIFEMIMSEEVGELQYDEKERLNFGAYYKEAQEEEGSIGGSIEVDILQMDKREAQKEKKDGESNSSSEELSKIEVEGRFIASRIKSLMSEENQLVFDKRLGVYRKIEYRDIVVLLRSTSTSAEIIMDELKRAEIPVYADVGNGYFEATEVKTVLSLLRVIDNPYQDIHMLAAMRSPIGGFSSEEFVQVRKANMKDSFYHAMEKYVQGEYGGEDIVVFQEELQLKLEKFINRLKGWRDKSKYSPLDQFVWELITETGYYGFVGAQGTGVQRQGNLKILYQRAKSFEKTSYKGLFNFINFIDKLKKSSGDMGSAKVIGENENVVRIMSIHKSKGLEFPVVFLSSMSKNFNMQDLNGNILFHEEMGFGPDCINLEKRVSYPTVFKEIIKSKMKKESLSEEMRILYVAFTRAREKLILTATVKNTDKYLNGVLKNFLQDDKKIISTSVLAGKSYLDWIMGTLFVHRDGKAIRERVGLSDMHEHHMYDNKSKWKINLLYGEDYLEELVDEEQGESLSEKIKEKAEKQTSGKYREAVHKRLDYSYEFMEGIELPTVATVTQLKKAKLEQLMEEDDNRERRSVALKKRPSFMEEKTGITPAERGTAIHNFIEYMNLEKMDSEEAVSMEIKRLVDNEFISFEEGESIKVRKIIRFLKSSIGERVARAQKENNLQREKAFGLNIKAYEIFPEVGNLEHGGKYDDESIKLQGIIDMFFEEDGEIVLLDFKTDYCTEDTVESVVQKYEEQLKYYAEAIEIILKKKVKEKYLYLFSIDKEIRI